MMNIKRLENLEVIETSEDINSTEVYYSNEYKRVYGKHYSYANLYDENFNLTRSVEIKYTNAIKDLVRIVHKDNKDCISLIAYKLTQINDDFYRVEKTESTLKELESISKSLKPKSWR